MMEPSSSSSWADAVEGVRWRKSLYGGLFGSLGVVLGWFVWFVIQAGIRDPASVLKAPFIGALVGAAYEFLKGYVGVARGTEAGRDEEAGALGLWRIVGRAFELAVFSTALNVVGDQLSAYLRPFCISVATFFPVGAAFTWGLSFLSSDGEASHPYEAVARGVVVGLLATAASFPLLLVPGIGWQPGRGFSWDYAAGLLGWWLLLGCGYALRWRSDTPRPLAPMGAAALVAVVMLGLSMGPADTESSNLFMKLFGFATRSAVSQPGAPAHALQDAEQLYQRQIEEGAGGSGAPVSAATSGWGNALANVLPCSIPVVAVQPLYAKRPDGTRVLVSAIPVRSQGIGGSSTRVIVCRELRQGTRSVLFRSWLVLLLFSLGLGVAQVLEARLRPARYAGSTLQRRDRRVFGWSAAVLLAALVYVGWTSGDAARAAGRPEFTTTPARK